MEEKQELEDKEALTKKLFNIEAEQTVLGRIILNNEYLNKINDFLKPKHFFEPAHQKIFEYILNTVQRSNIVADSITIKNFFNSDEYVSKIGGENYISILLSMGAGVVDIVGYAQMIKDLSVKREIINITEESTLETYKEATNITAEKQLERIESKLFELGNESETGRGFANISLSVKEAVEGARLAKERDSSISGIPTDFIDFDRLLGGLQNSDLIVVAGRPSMGKSAIAVNIAYNIAKYFQDEYRKNKSKPEKNVGIISLEMSAEQIALRILSMETGINSLKFKNGEIEDSDLENIIKSSQDISRLPLFIDDSPSLSISTVRTRVRRLVRQKNLGFLMIDYLQLLHGTSDKARDNRVLEIGEITQGLKAIAKEFKIPVMALSQLSRSVEQREDKRPMLSDLRESGSIEQDADIVTFIYRAEYYEERKKPPDGDPKMDAWIARMDYVRNKTELIIAKNRNGPIGNVVLHFDSNTTRFKNYGGDYPDLQQPGK